MRGKTCLVTGATDGIGWMTARALARDGARVIVVGRNPEKGERRVADLREETGNGAVRFERADLASQEEIRALAMRLRANLPRLDVLVNNVGAWFHRRGAGPDNIEMTWALNHLGQFLLTGLLLDLLGAAQGARIVNVSSRAHQGPQVDFDDPEGARRYAGWRAYQQSKLANVLFTYRLAERLGAAGHVTANCLHPGFVASRFGHNNSGFARIVAVASQRLFAISEEKGAVTSHYLAADESVGGTSGRYFVRCRPVESSAASRDRDAQSRLWRLSEEMTGFRYPL
ncbi:MAG: SDR family oxidoreductase [Immundisolibacterales bacterium]|nr:SDR family oxidoreductase [Immundisolibacterales bacterium]